MPEHPIISHNRTSDSSREINAIGVGRITWKPLKSHDERIHSAAIIQRTHECERTIDRKRRERVPRTSRESRTVKRHAGPWTHASLTSNLGPASRGPARGRACDTSRNHLTCPHCSSLGQPSHRQVSRQVGRQSATVKVRQTTEQEQKQH